MEHVAKNGKKLKLLIDTGSNKNYLNKNFIRTPLVNENPFLANTVGGNVKITHHAFVNLFGQNYPELKFFLLTTV